MYKKIMVPLDGSELAECVIPHVEAVAGGSSGAEVVFVRAVEPFHLRSGAAHFNEEQKKQIDAKAEADAEEYLNGLASRLQLGGMKVRTEVLYGNIADTLADYATGKDIDLIIIATHGRSGISRWVWGSVADRILRSACIPVLMVRAPGCVSGI